MPTLSVTWCPNPLRPTSDREHKTVALMDGDTVYSVIVRLGLRDTPLAATLNGQRVYASMLRATTVRTSDVLVLQQAARGIETSAIAAKFIMYGDMAYGAAMAWATVISFAANAVISMAISAVASSLAKPSGSSNSQKADNAPNAYGIEGGANGARPYEPLPLVLGEHRVFPDYATRPFAEFVLDPTAVQEVINNTPATEMRLHPPFSVTAGVAAEPWTKISANEFVTYYGDNAARTLTSSVSTVTQPHTFVISVAGSNVQVATYEDYLSLTSQTDNGNYGGG
jgi:hypothetical protein